MEKITALLKQTPEIKVNLQKQERIKARLILPSKLVVKITSFYEELPVYEAPYIVKPTPFKSQELCTKDKKMKENLTVLEIPYYDVSNKTGNTIYIGSEVKTNGN